jgi:hypothetical protein
MKKLLLLLTHLTFIEQLNDRYHLENNWLLIPHPYNFN